MIHKRSRAAVCGIVILIFLTSVQVFSDEISVEDAVHAAFINSGQYKIRLLEQQQKGYAADEVKAKMFPVIDFQLTATFMTNPPEGITIRKGEMGYAPSFNSEAPAAFPDQDYILMEDPERTHFKIETGLDQPIYTWGKLKYALKLAEKDVEIASAVTEGTAAEIRKQTTQAYFALQFTRGALEKIDQAEKIVDQIVKDREEEYKEELVNLQSVLEVQKNAAVLTTMTAELIEAHAKAKRGLYVLTGIPLHELEADDLVLSSLLGDNIGEIVQREELVRYALLHSADVGKVYLQREQAELYEVLEKRSGMLRPDFFLHLGMDVTGQRIPVVGANWTDTWDINFLITLGTKITLWDSGQSAAKRKQAAVSQQIAAEGLNQTITNTEMTVRGLLDAHNTAFRRVREYEMKDLLLNEQLKNAEVSYENELITRSERLGAEAAVLQNEVEYLSVLLAYQNIQAELAAAAGLGTGIKALNNFR